MSSPFSISHSIKYAAFCLTLSALAACNAQSDANSVRLDLGDIEDYQDFLEDRGDVILPVPFKPEPLFVSAIGKVQAQPDIAVITAKITAEDKNESRAIHEMGEIINAIQTALQNRQIETGFTAINSSREFDERCRNENRFAQRRHNEIRNDYYFNQQLERKGDTKTKRRDPKPRVAQQVCFAQTIKVSTHMVIRIQPADAAGDVLRALSDAGAENSRLYGYDFTDYDALYQDAADKAVKLAREKAQSVARLAGGTLGEIESFSVSPPDRTGRFGPQPNVIRPANRYQGPKGSVIDRHIESYEDNPSYRWKSGRSGGARNGEIEYELDEIVVTATRKARNSIAAPAPKVALDVQDNNASRVNNTQDILSSPSGNGPAGSQSGNNTNALSISLLSGPQTISVAAELGYHYETPLNGKIIVEPDDES